jgi:glycosyltransferase involved in cell wall biosynthesis
MRIAFVSVMTGSPWAASEVLWADTAALALKQGHDVLVSTFRWPVVPKELQALASLGAQLDLRSLTRWRRRSALMTRLTGSFRSLQQFKPDAICINQGGTYDIARSGHNAALRSVLRRLDVPYIVMCHCEQPPPPKRNINAARNVFARASIVGMVSENLRLVSESHLGVRLPNVRTFHNPVNLKRIEYLPWPATQRTLKMAFVGRLDPVKNLESLITALADDDWKARDWSLTVFGAGPDRGSLEKQCSAAGLSQQIRFAGFAGDIAAVWAEHQVLVMPSRFEGVPLAMIEAMLCGRPVVATNTGGISEWLEDARCGYLISAPAPNEIAAALEKTWAQRDRLEAMGRYAHERTLARRDADPARTLLHWLAECAAKSRCAAEDRERSGGVSDQKIASAANR